MTGLIKLSGQKLILSSKDDMRTDCDPIPVSVNNVNICEVVRTNITRTSNNMRVGRGKQREVFFFLFLLLPFI